LEQDDRYVVRKKKKNKSTIAVIVIFTILCLSALVLIIILATDLFKAKENDNVNASGEYVAQSEQPTEKATEKKTEMPSTKATTEAPTTEEPTTEKQTEALPDGTKYEVPVACGDLYVLDGQLFNPCCAGHGTGDYYAGMVNYVGEKLPDNVQLYNVVAPTAFGACLSVDVQEEMIGNNQPELIDYIYSQIDPKNAITVKAYQNITRHNAEYIYFNSDHHWTQTGAYYAYQAWCDAKGIEAHTLDYFKTKHEFPGYLGYFYGLAGKPSFLSENPDTVVAYVPNGTNDMVFTDRDGNKIAWDVVRDYSGRDGSYVCFIAGDQPFVEIENPAINDGSACLLIKESYGNAFAPFLVDHYQHVYVADYRYYEGNVSKLVADKNIQDVIIMNNLEAIGGKRCDMIMAMFP